MDNNIEVFKLDNELSIDDYIKYYVGKKYDKFIKNKLNIWAFIFSFLYYFYRKMYLYGLLVFILQFLLLNTLDNNTYLIVNILLLFITNPIYLNYARTKVSKIYAFNTDNEVVKNLCIKKGSTSIIYILLGIISSIIIGIILLYMYFIFGITSSFINLFKPNNNTYLDNSSESILISDATLNGYSCFNSNCTLLIDDISYSIDNIDSYKLLNDYKDYLNIDIYYIIKGKTRYLTDYNAFIKDSNIDVTNLTRDTKNESILRDKLGLYNLGTYTKKLKYITAGSSGFKNDENISYTYTNYIFLDDNNNQLELNYIHGNNSINLIENNIYTVEFSIKMGTFGYEYTIISIR